MDRTIIVETECIFCKRAIATEGEVKIKVDCIEFKCPHCGKINKLDYRGD